MAAVGLFVCFAESAKSRQHDRAATVGAADMKFGRFVYVGTKMQVEFEDGCATCGFAAGVIRRWLLVVLPPTKEKVNAFAHVRLSVCLLARFGFGMDLDEMLRVDRCRDMQELGHGVTGHRIIVQMPEPGCFLRYRMRCNAEFYYVEKIPRTGIGPIWAPVAATTRDFKMSRGNNFVGGTCSPPSALLVCIRVSCEFSQPNKYNEFYKCTN